MVTSPASAASAAGRAVRPRLALVTGFGLATQGDRDHRFRPVEQQFAVAVAVGSAPCQPGPAPSAIAAAPTGWMNSGDDAAGAAMRMTAERQRRSIAAIQSGITDPFAPSVPVPPEPSASTTPSTVELAARATIQGKASLGLSVNRASQGATPTDIAATVERRLSERPEEISEGARALSKAIADQIAELNASKPNEPDRLAQQNDFVVFLQTIAGGLDALAESIDRAIAAGSVEKPEPILLGKAGEIARQLSAAVVKGLNETAPISSIVRSNSAYSQRVSRSCTLSVLTATSPVPLPPL